MFSRATASLPAGGSLPYANTRLIAIAKNELPAIVQSCEYRMDVNAETERLLSLANQCSDEAFLEEFEKSRPKFNAEAMSIRGMLNVARELGYPVRTVLRAVNVLIWADAGFDVKLLARDLRGAILNAEGHEIIEAALGCDISAIRNSWILPRNLVNRDLIIALIKIKTKFPSLRDRVDVYASANSLRLV